MVDAYKKEKVSLAIKDGVFYKELADHNLDEIRSYGGSVQMTCQTINTFRHPMIPKILSFDNTSYTMDVIKGEEFQEHFNGLHKKGKEKLVFKLLLSISDMFRYLVEQRHPEPNKKHFRFTGRDIEISHNIMVDVHGDFKCIDFDSWYWKPKAIAYIEMWKVYDDLLIQLIKDEL
jgi:hypothetical protein